MGLSSSESAASGSVPSTLDESAPKSAGNAKNSVFAGLVQAEDDTVGLLAYALYKQNKLDWLTSFFNEQQRELTQGELLAYHLGEIAPRRLLTYRRLAVDVLARDPGGREGEGLVGNPAWAASGAPAAKPAEPSNLAEVILARRWLTILVGALGVIGTVAVVVLVLYLINPAIIRDILPAATTSAQPVPQK
jgi:hypothetical protein